MSKYRDQIRAEQRADDDWARPQTDEELAWDYGLDLQDVQADRELAEKPWVPPYLRRQVTLPWLNEYDPSLPSEAEKYCHPESGF